MNRVYEKKLKSEGHNITARFRITLGGQKVLKEKYDDEIMSIIFKALDNAEIMADVFEQALTFRGNDNQITDGEEMYDLLVDNGVSGIGDFADILFGIAAKSGIVSDADAEAFAKKAKGMMDDIIVSLDEPAKNA